MDAQILRPPGVAVGIHAELGKRPALFTEVVKLGGTISGEHGIGIVQKPYIDLAFNETSINLMKNIKKVFDPKGILNPGKIF